MSDIKVRARGRSKRRIVNPHRIMRRQHPYDVWLALYRFSVMDKLAGNAGAFHSPAEIASVLYDNFSELTAGEQALVITMKISFALTYLKVNYWVDQRIEYHRRGTDLVDRKFDFWRGKSGAFMPIKGIDELRRFEMTKLAIDKEWGEWIGRRNTMRLLYGD